MHYHPFGRMAVETRLGSAIAPALPVVARRRGVGGGGLGRAGRFVVGCRGHCWYRVGLVYRIGGIDEDLSGEEWVRIYTCLAWRRDTAASVILGIT